MPFSKTVLLDTYRHFFGTPCNVVINYSMIWRHRVRGIWTIFFGPSTSCMCYQNLYVYDIHIIYLVYILNVWTCELGHGHIIYTLCSSGNVLYKIYTIQRLGTKKWFIMWNCGLYSALHSWLLFYYYYAEINDYL